jgi:hypothetical protein
MQEPPGERGRSAFCRRATSQPTLGSQVVHRARVFVVLVASITIGFRTLLGRQQAL